VRFVRFWERPCPILGADLEFLSWCHRVATVPVTEVRAADVGAVGTTQNARIGAARRAQSADATECRSVRVVAGWEIVVRPRQDACCGGAHSRLSGGISAIAALPVGSDCALRTGATGRRCPSACAHPRSSNSIPDPATRSLAVLRLGLRQVERFPAILTDVRRDPDQLAAAFLALARVNFRPDLQADVLQVLSDSHRPPRTPVGLGGWPGTSSTCDPSRHKVPAPDLAGKSAICGVLRMLTKSHLHVITTPGSADIQCAQRGPSAGSMFLTFGRLGRARAAGSSGWFRVRVVSGCRGCRRARPAGRPYPAGQTPAELWWCRTRSRRR
jgi:hypothetical protein